MRAKALDPSLDRNKILPRIDPAGIARARQDELQKRQDMQAKFEQAVGSIERLPARAFPQLPAAVAAALDARKCQVPQPAERNGPRNVIRGEFFAKGESGWAVLCAVNGSASLLVFRNDRGTHPDTLAAVEEKTHLQGLDGDKIGYSREIAPASPAFMLRHYRAYGGPAPPPLDHQGIDDAFLGKASVTWYYYQGKWRCLQGAD